MAIINFKNLSPNQTLIANILGSLLSRFSNIIFAAISVPLALDGLGEVDYAVYATMLSFMIFFSFSDLGIGLSVVNPVSTAKTQDEIEKAKIAVSQAWGVQLIVGSVIVVGGSIITLIVLKFFSDEVFSFDQSFVWITLLVAIAIGLVTGLGQRVMFALGRNLEANLWLVGGKLVALGALYYAAFSDAGLLGFVTASQLVPMLVGGVLFYYLFKVSRADLAPHLRFFNRKDAFLQIRSGLLFLLLSFTAFCLMGIDNIVLGIVSTPEVVTQYDVTIKPLFYASSLAGIILFPVWPHLSKEIAAQRQPKWSTILKIFLVFSVFVAILCFVIWFWLNPVLKLWVGEDFVPLDRTVTALVAFNTFFIAIAMLQSMILNAKDIIVKQAKIQAMFLCLLIPFKFLMTYYLGPFGIVLALTLIYIPLIIYIHFRLLAPAFQDR